MDLALVVSALMLGLAGAPHCTAMCGAACAAVLRRGQGSDAIVFHLARIGGYAAAGALAASSVGVLATLGQASPALRPLWTLVNAAALALGLWLLWHGRQPAWLENIGRGGRQAAPQSARDGWQRLRGPAEAAAAGTAWVAWPCGLLQSALVVAALANSPAGGALAMAAFAAASASGLALGPWLWLRLGVSSAAGGASAWATRAAGALLVGACAWALGRGLWLQVAAYCGF